MILLALVGGQVGLHGCLNGMRLAVPLQAAAAGRGAALVGLLMALFAVFPFLIAIPAGRFTDRRGYHPPVRLAAALACAGALLGTLSHGVWAQGAAAALSGAGSAIGMIALQRTAGRLAGTPAQRLRIFSWVALAPSLATFIGPALAGALIDHVGWRAAFAGLAVLPLLTLIASVAVPRDAADASGAGNSVEARTARAWELLRDAHLLRLLFINWLIAACWDAHAFALPLLGHARGLSATAIAAVLATYAVASAGVRVVIPLLAERLRPRSLMMVALAVTAAVYLLYPLLHSAWAMAACAGVLGLTLGAIQPAVMATLHTVAPPGRQGEALGFRSTVIHFSTLVMPLGFGALGAALGVASVFWLTAAALAAGAWQAGRLPATTGG
ncbi:MFS transporter [Caldimonas thermodepolymerans]|uniref:MFS transporter n=1 Tax=Caldimonas thermodepolymerans TaxID=215580 RepID=UPI0022354751|nr:MFS transporter [Caldimonas thermodepolymerans]UZG46051.1 MFS transporter [Caldimonas thermodepolymerans]